MAHPSLRPAKKPVLHLTAPDELRDLTRDVSRLTPWHGDPERFVLSREQTPRQLHRLARRLETNS